MSSLIWSILISISFSSKWEVCLDQKKNYLHVYVLFKTNKLKQSISIVMSIDFIKVISSFSWSKRALNRHTKWNTEKRKLWSKWSVFFHHRNANSIFNKLSWSKQHNCIKFFWMQQNMQMTWRRIGY